MTDETDNNTLAIEIANTAETEGGDNKSVSINLAEIPQDARLELLKSAVRTTVTNRVNVAMVRNRALRAPFAAWAAYEAAMATDPLQTTVAKPDGEKPTGEAPAALDPIAKAGEAIADLLKGELRQQSKRARVKPALRKTRWLRRLLRLSRALFSTATRPPVRKFPCQLPATSPPVRALTCTRMRSRRLAATALLTSISKSTPRWRRVQTVRRSKRPAMPGTSTRPRSCSALARPRRRPNCLRSSRGRY
jgi:hypothetical protein